MSLRCFVDARMLIYLHDRSAARKRALTRHSLRSIRRHGELVITPQVAHDFYARAIDQFPFVPRHAIRDFLGDLMPACHSAAPSELMGRAFHIEDRFKFEWWDCLMIASALLADCRLLLSEDLEDGLAIERTTVVNPFVTDIETVFSSLKDR